MLLNRDISSDPMAYLDSIDLYNIILFTAKMLADDMKLEVEVPYIGIPIVVH
jgi:hypothetical protein